MAKYNQKERKVSTLILLIIAGEAIFFLPFVMARIFRPTLLDFFQISNTELGRWFSVYGVVAMISYLFGGRLADRFPARNLMALALWLTSIGGIVIFFNPPAASMKVLYAVWGFTTICLFWAAMIRATREWGGPDYQGRAFGWLEGGRGAVAALLGTLTFVIFSWAANRIPDQMGTGQGWHPFQWIILTTSALTFLSGLLVWLFVPRNRPEHRSKEPRVILREVSILMGNPSLWILALIIVCAYSGYKITDDFSLYAREVLRFEEVGAAGVGTVALWFRALVAILAGYLADRFNRQGIISVGFGLTMMGSLILGSGILNQVLGLLLLNLTLTATGIFAIRALYFAVLQEAGIPIGLTGTAVGMVSFIGFTPEVFMSPLMGHLLDQQPGTLGHQHVFLLLSLVAFVGLIASLLFKKSTRFRTFNV